MLSQNREVLTDFVKYCEAHPEQRFWQALRNWNQEIYPDQNFIMTATLGRDDIKFFDSVEDTFFREAK